MSQRYNIFLEYGNNYWIFSAVRQAILIHRVCWVQKQSRDAPLEERLHIKLCGLSVRSEMPKSH